MLAQTTSHARRAVCRRAILQEENGAWVVRKEKMLPTGIGGSGKNASRSRGTVEPVVSIRMSTSCSERQHGGKYVLATRAKVAQIVENELVRDFLDLTETCSLRKDLREFVFRQLVRKTFNARIGAFFRLYNTENVKRGTAGESMTTIRGDLRHNKKRKLTD